ncbi:MmgE/PrpD family protein [Streptomyces sp. NPDC059272]|uniref:MmgE/PrpD family protein n=1 Tax=Streptomyces sp. NPDC059272 TaxID=3346800 RepID=UPI0036B7153B
MITTATSPRRQFSRFAECGRPTGGRRWCLFCALIRLSLAVAAKGDGFPIATAIGRSPACRLLLSSVMLMALADELSSYAALLSFSDLPDEVAHTAKQRLVDSLGGGLGASASLPARNGRPVARTYPSTACTLLGTRQTNTPDAAALVNGTMVRFSDFNDGYIGQEVGHPSDNIATRLAVAESEGASRPPRLLPSPN